MADEVNLFRYCSSAALQEKLWRGMFLAHIFGIDMPEDMKICRLTEELSDPITHFEFTESLSSLLILYGGGYIDSDDFQKLYSNCDEYAQEFADIENILFEQSDETPEDKLNSEIVRNVLFCAINSKKYEEIQPISISEALSLFNSKYTFIKDGFVYVKDAEYIKALAEHGVTFGKVADKKAEMISEPTQEDMLFGIRDFLYITPVYKKPYYKDFLKYVRTANIPYSENLEDRYNEYIHKIKMTFILKVYPRVRNICIKFPNWFDYNLPDNTSIRDLTIDVTDSVGKDTEYTENQLLNVAVNKAFVNREYDNDTVLEFRHDDHVIYFIVTGSKKVDRLDNDSFTKVPFNFDHVWTTISEWSREKKIRKSVIDGKTEITITPEIEWDKIKSEDRDYAKRLIIEQMQLREKELNKNKFIQKLSELKANAANELQAKQDEAEKKAQEKAKEKEKNKLRFNNRKGGTSQS